jgi:hypothetical protein
MYIIYEKTIVELPTKGKNTRQYTSNGAEQWHPYFVSLDFECLLKKMKNKKNKKYNISQQTHTK